jgi:hypothetical protein
MHRKVIGLTLVLLGVTALAAFAVDVLVPGESTPQQTVAARKLAMAANGALAGDTQAKIASGNVKAAVANARALMSIATFLPLVFTETFSEVYPVAGSKYFFKGGDPADVARLAGGLAGAAEDLLKAADSGDKTAAGEKAGKLGGSCGACHAVLRGSY